MCTTLDMQQVCRLCLCKLCQMEQCYVTPLFHDDINNDECRQLRLQIADLCSINILQDDDLPKFICSKCKIKLRDAYEFVNLCKSSNNKLHEHESSKHCQDTDNTEVNRPESNDNDRSNLGCETQETSLKEQVTLNPNINCNELPNNNRKQYLCHVCSKIFASMSGLRFHLKSHYGSKPHTCQQCDKSFAIPSYKKRHERIHTNDKHLICHICSTAFASPNGLRYHLRTHTGEAKYHCETCGKSFTRYKYLKQHTFTHTGEKPFVCKLCGSAYGNGGSLFVHEKKCKLRHVLDLSQSDASKTVETITI